VKTHPHPEAPGWGVQLESSVQTVPGHLHCWPAVHANWPQFPKLGTMVKADNVSINTEAVSNILMRIFTMFSFPYN
jgi:hypothetical protein